MTGKHSQLVNAEKTTVLTFDPKNACDCDTPLIKTTANGVRLCVKKVSNM